MLGWEQLERLWSNLLGLGARRLAALGLVGLAVFAAVGFGSYYLSRPEYETLYAGLNSQDVSRIGAALKEAGVPFDVNAEGTKVMVRSEQTSQARMLLAEKGLPSSANAGYELFDKLGPIGLTSFMQEITRVRALEGELSRTIQTMKGVKAARVHIVLPENGSFRRGRQPPSASVVIRTEAVADASAVQAIRHLVAAAVPALGVEQVNVLSADGTVLAAAGDATTAAPTRLAELERTVGKDLEDNVRKTLAPYLGLSNFQVSVATRLNMDKKQTNETTFDPESKVERSLRVVKETGTSQDTSSRAPVGVDQNIPKDQAGSEAGDQSKKANERREDLTNYELNSKTIQTVSEGYRIEGLTIAVVINRKRLLASLGESAAPEAVQAQVKEVERLVGTAAGVDVKRGDQISVAAVEFADDTAILESDDSAVFFEQLISLVASLVKAATVLGVAFVVIWFGLRPLTRALLEQPVAAAVAGGNLALEGAESIAAATGGPDQTSPAAQAAVASRPPVQMAEEPNLIEDLTNSQRRIPQKRLEQMVNLDEEQAATVLKQWMREREA
ncbi:MAG TPA: flagellar basal-body MS-ring/collar protein FliF [Hyphomicrobiaceae bacterium]|nr:flagellar basal-body MS-ring/collar protein FliF [Hyphomicrobiaceae bacterium]